MLILEMPMIIILSSIVICLQYVEDNENITLNHLIEDDVKFCPLMRHVEEVSSLDPITKLKPQIDDGIEHLCHLILLSKMIIL